jgi:hypothetical protein
MTWRRPPPDLLARTRARSILRPGIAVVAPWHSGLVVALDGEVLEVPPQHVAEWIDRVQAVTQRVTRATGRSHEAPSSMHEIVQAVLS